MSKTGINTKFAKCFILFMALNILLQGFIYLALSLWGLVLTNCSNQNTELYDEGKISANPLRFIMDLLYFKQQNCGNWSLTVSSQQYPLDINWTTSMDLTNRELIFFIVYIVVSALWVLSSLLVIATLCGRLTVWVTALCFWPWFLFVIAGCVLDVVATVFHVLDITHTTTTADLVSYVGLENVPAAVLTTLQTYDAYYIAPAIIMTCISCRVVLVWILNLFGSLFCITLVQAILKSRRDKEEAAKNMRLAAKATQETRGISTIGTASAQSGAMVTDLDADMNSVQNVNAQSTYRETDAHPERLNYPRQMSNTNGSAVPPRLQQQLSVVSPLNYRYAGMENAPNPQSPVRVSAELRNQMPWSYMPNSNQRAGQQRNMYPELSRQSNQFTEQ